MQSGNLHGEDVLTSNTTVAYSLEAPPGAILFLDFASLGCFEIEGTIGICRHRYAAISVAETPAGACECHNFH